MATLGFTPAAEVFEGPYGHLPLFEGEWDLALVLDDLNRIWRIAECSHKPFPSGRATHAGIDGVMALRKQHAFTAAGVAAVHVIAPSLIVRLVGRPAARDPGASYARLCLGYAVAKVLLHSVLELAHFRGDALVDPATYAVAQRVNLDADDSPAPNALAPQSVIVALNNDVDLSWRCDTMLASPARKIDRQQQLAKFRRCLDIAKEPVAAPAADRMVAMVDGLDEIADWTCLISSHARRSGGTED